MNFTGKIDANQWIKIVPGYFDIYIQSVSNNMPTDTTGQTSVTTTGQTSVTGTINNEKVQLLNKIVKKSQKLFIKHFDQFVESDLKSWNQVFKKLEALSTSDLTPSSREKVKILSLWTREMIENKSRAAEGLNKYREIQMSMKQLKKMSAENMNDLEPEAIKSLKETVTYMADSSEFKIKFRSVERFIGVLNKNFNNFEQSISDSLLGEKNEELIELKKIAINVQSELNSLSNEFNGLSNEFNGLLNNKNTQKKYNELKFSLFQTIQKINLYTEMFSSVKSLYSIVNDKFQIEKSYCDNRLSDLIGNFKLYLNGKCKIEEFTKYIKIYGDYIIAISGLINTREDLFKYFSKAHNRELEEAIQSEIFGIINEFEYLEIGSNAHFMSNDDKYSNLRILKSIFNINNYKIGLWNEDKLFSNIINYFNKSISFENCKQNCLEIFEKSDKVCLTETEIDALKKKIALENKNLTSLKDTTENLSLSLKRVPHSFVLRNFCNKNLVIYNDVMMYLSKIKSELNDSLVFHSLIKKNEYLSTFETEMKRCKAKVKEALWHTTQINSNWMTMKQFNMQDMDIQELCRIYDNYVNLKISDTQFDELTAIQFEKHELENHIKDLNSKVNGLKFQFSGMYLLNFTVVNNHYNQYIQMVYANFSKKSISTNQLIEQVKEKIGVINTVLEFYNSRVEDCCKNAKIQDLIYRRLISQINQETFGEETIKELKKVNISPALTAELKKLRAEFQRLVGDKEAPATFEEIKKSYRSWQRKNHTDKGGDDLNKIKQVNDKYGEIKDKAENLPKNFTF